MSSAASSPHDPERWGPVFGQDHGQTKKPPKLKMTKVACTGECMIELRPAPGGLFSRGFGGDTLNTAVYLSRLGIATDYITALGDDTLSDEMIAGWQAEGIGTSRVARLKGKLPGVYMIDTDATGERKSFHW